MDGIGEQTNSARPIGTSILTRGCITNPAGVPALSTPLSAINSSAVFDAARRMSQSVRILPAYSVVAYAVESGKSILWFRTKSIVTRSQWWDGIADEVRAEAIPGGWSNEWLLDFQWKAYNDSVSSIWKPDAFSYYWPVQDRCGFYAPELENNGNRALLWQTSYGNAGASGNILAEMPTGFRYMPLDSPHVGRQWLNTIPDSGGSPTYPYTEETREAFYQSCKIYKPPYEIASCVSEKFGAIDCVKVTLTGRLEHTDGAPASIDRDASTWSGPTIASEAYRTDENALRLWIVHEQGGTGYNPPLAKGDQAAWSTLDTEPDAPFASIVPAIYLVKLLPKPFDDGNDSQDLVDTPLWHDFWGMCEWYLRASCEGFVDPLSSNEQLCEYYFSQDPPAMPSSWGLHCYTYEQLCHQSFGQNWVGLMPAQSTTHTTAAQTRPDFPHGFGQMPNTRATAEMHNRFAAMVDNLASVPLMIPYTLQVRNRGWIGTKSVTLPMSCSIPGNTKAYIDNQLAPAATTPDSTFDTDWIDQSYAYALRSASLEGCPFTLTQSALTCEWRVALTADIEKTFPPLVAEILNVTDDSGTLYIAGGISVPGVWVHETAKSTRYVTTSGNPANVCGGVSDIIFYDGEYSAWDYATTTSRDCPAAPLTAGAITPPDIPASDYGLASLPDGDVCEFGAASSSSTLYMVETNGLQITVPLQ